MIHFKYNKLYLQVQHFLKNIDKKRKVQLFIIFMIVIALLAGSVTYALIELNIIYRGNQENTISSCSFNIDIKENNPINLVSTYPMDDNEATKLEPYKFSITPNSQTCSKLQYNITIVSNCDTCTKTNGICNDNNLCNCNEGYQIDPNLIKYEITNKTTGEKTVGINPYKMGVAGSMAVGTTINFELRMWIINSATNDDLYIKENGSYKEDSNGLILTKNFCSKVKITGTDTPYLTPTGADTLIALTNNVNDSGLYTITHPADNTLQIGTTESIIEYRYRGASPKNYVTFNNEIWRILGVFPTDDGTGNIENRVKLIRNESIGGNYWNTKMVSSTSSYNNWAGATLQTKLNETYLTGLSSEAQSMIGNAKYYLGGYYSNDNSISNLLPTPFQFYSYERKISGSDYYYGTNPNSWIGKLAIIYVSDYGYASINCENINLTDNGTNNFSSCISNNWLSNVETGWTLSQNAKYNDTSFVVNNDGAVRHYAMKYGINEVRPVLYLTSSAKITGGSGTSTDPYTFGL